MFNFVFPIARLFFLSKLDDVKSPCIINVKTSAAFKVGILQCFIFILQILPFNTNYYTKLVIQ